MSQKIRFINSLAFQIIFTSTLCKFFLKKNFFLGTNGKISIEEYIILEILICNPHLNCKEIAQNLFIDKQEIEKIVSQLERKNLITKIKKNDEKINLQHYKLTNNGEKYYNEINYNDDNLFIFLSKFISEKELTSFFKTLIKIRNIFKSLENSKI